MDTVALWVGRAFLVAAGFAGAACAIYFAANFAWHQMGIAGKLAALRLWKREELAKQKQHELKKLAVGRAALTAPQGEEQGT